MTRLVVPHRGARRRRTLRATAHKSWGETLSKHNQLDERLTRAITLVSARRWWMVPVGGAVVAVALCLALVHGIGFPLDDSWIHQDFARTLATTGQFAYLPGRSGAGSTSPVWVILLLPPQLVFRGQPPLWLVMGWPALLGCAALAATGMLAGLTARELAGRAGVSARVGDLAGIVAGLGVVVEWHLVWAAASGMETILFALAIFGLFYAASREIYPAMLGIMTALSFAIRPEAALAGGLVVAGSLWGAMSERRKGFQGGTTGRIQAIVRWGWRWFLPFGISCLAGCVPYVVANLAASGHILPSTFYAKSTYYAAPNYVVGAASDLVGVTKELVGSSPVVLLGLALSYSHWLLSRTHDEHDGKDGVVKIARAGGLVRDEVRSEARSNAIRSFPLRGILWAWVLGLVAIYLGRGVATILHGRYLMPMLPELIALCSVGTASLLLDQKRRLLGMVAAALILGTGVFSAVRGAQIYGDNVRFIDGTDVAAALWLRQHAGAGSLVATHDIGAIGYFSGHPLVDIAGLADPEIIPLLHNQTALESYLRQHHARYVVMYTTWFPPPNVLVRDLHGREVFHSGVSSDFVIYRTDW